MDVGSDFITKEFLNILFFEQKNLVIFPYVDLKHLSSLTTFTVGYDVVNIDSTALNNIEDVIESEVASSYSQNPIIYLIYNLDRQKFEKLLKLKKVKCILNIRDNISDLALNNNYVFYNKKNKTFINYDFPTKKLDVENDLISSSNNEIVLLDKIQHIKTIATRIFIEITEKGHQADIKTLFSEYDKKYKIKILDFVKNYFQIEIPDNIYSFQNELPNSLKGSQNFNHIKSNGTNAPYQEFIEEYNSILEKKNLANEFVQLLHDYRVKNVNDSNLNLEQLYDPTKLYEYLRQHHWKKEITEDFLKEWLQMKNTDYQLQEDDFNDFKELFKKLNIDKPYLFDDTSLKQKISQEDNSIEQINDNTTKSNSIPSVKNFNKFKKWFLKKLDEIEDLIQ